ncbi:hypothetical protein OIV83_003005 [Microbotryomycetes sp. JL201]|nr:hypothetical protein OIV83_003005 [Microbotryomycetes sp. JL201]
MAAAAAPSHAPAHHQMQTQHASTKRQQQQAHSPSRAISGLIHLPQSRQQASPSPRKRTSKHNNSQTEKAAAREASASAKMGSLGDDDVRPTPVENAHQSALLPPQLTPPTHLPGAAPASTPSVNPAPASAKAKRTKGRSSSRQSSPPLASASAAAPTAPDTRTHSDSQEYTGSTQLHAFDALAPSSSSDEWDMPAIDSLAIAQRTRDALTWQQQGLSRSNSGNKRAAAKSAHNKQRPSAPRASGDVGAAKPSRNIANSKPQAAHQSSHASFTQVTHSHVSSALTWQQELLQQSDSATARTPDSHKGVSPAKQRRQQQKDQETFGLGALDLATSDVSAHVTPKQINTQHVQNTSKPRHAAATPKVTPSKPIEERYAGPTFHNSPLASSLPTPSFLLRKKQALEMAQS